MLSFICSWDMSGLISKLFPAPLPPTRTGVRNMWKIFSLVPSKKPLTRETDTMKSWAILKNFNFGMLKLTKKPILPNCQVPTSFFVNLIIQELKFQRQFLWREVFLREREKIFSTYSVPGWPGSAESPTPLDEITSCGTVSCPKNTKGKNPVETCFEFIWK